jgi:hypothetical protein
VAHTQLHSDVSSVASVAFKPAPRVSAAARARHKPIGVDCIVGHMTKRLRHAATGDGAVEPDAYTDIDGSVAAELSLKGKQWGRPNDTFGLAGIVNEISKVHQN